MVNLILSLLPSKYKAYARLSLRLFEHLDTAKERDAAIQFLMDAIESDGYPSVAEWSRWGGMLGILRKPKT